MDRALVRARPLAAILVAVVGAVLAQVTVLAAAADAANRPSVTFSPPEVNGSAVTLDFSVNRPVKAIASAVCTLTDSSEVETVVSCGTAVPGPGTRDTTYRTILADVAGEHVFAVTLTLTDGGTVTSTEPVAVEAGEPEEFAAAKDVCESLSDGVFVAHQYWWQTWNCDFNADTSETVTAGRSVLQPLCSADGGIHFAEVGTVPGPYTFGCWNV